MLDLVEVRKIIPPNIDHSNSDIVVKDRGNFVSGIKVVGWRVVHHSQGCVSDFELSRGWKVRIGQYQSRYGSNTPFLV